MKRLVRRTLLSVILTGLPILNGALSAQTSTVIKVLDPSEIEGIAGVVLLVNPGDSRKSRSLVTDATGEAMARGLDCSICTIVAFDPRGLFVSRTTEFSGSSPRFRLVLAIQPLLDIVRDPKAVSIELGINDSKGQALAQHEIVIRPTVMTLENNNQLFIQDTGPSSHVKVQLRAGDYIAATLTGDTVLEARFEIVTAKEACPDSIATCIVVSPRSSARAKFINLQLSPNGDPPKAR